MSLIIIIIMVDRYHYCLYVTSAFFDISPRNANCVATAVDGTKR